MNEPLYYWYVEALKKLKIIEELNETNEESRISIIELKNHIRVLEENFPEIKNDHDKLIANQKSFSSDQIDFICYQIGEWYLEWRTKIIAESTGTHRLGFAKEMLKIRICGE